ncbi:helix-turn-helix domain-containing protein [Arthrobacter sp. I2-34]|uniref:Helix-turn-helix domain-containing protein n=1 Tax=Arthrobacter hankyongi TaxID=2904801 RepID=A0ABS9L8A6_9MICC|nr:helix-turn-helix domain-containing protein [Arthrobacter hankyongi]MCG2622907.1 helix-turn-helix domain-containing protein [Arthrobacter hankyongi]
MRSTPTTKGHLTPGPSAAVTRLPVPGDLAHLVRQVWIPEWDLPAGEQVEQLVLGYPASNVVVEPHGTGLYGPTSRASVKVLAGRGWAVGALLRPAGSLLFSARPADLLDRTAPVDAPGLHRAVGQAMAAAGTPGPGGHRARAAELLLGYLRTLAAGPSGEDIARGGALANRMVDLIDDGDVRSVAGLAARLNLSQRSLQRLASRYVGMSAVLMLRRRRLQDAAERVRTDPGTDLRELAAELGFSDQAHLTREFRLVLGFTPRQYPAPGPSTSPTRRPGVRSGRRTGPPPAS